MLSHVRQLESAAAPQLQHGLCQGRVPRMLTAERLLSGKLWASPLAYRQNMFLSGAGSPWSLMPLLLLSLPPPPPPSLSVFFFVMLSFHSPPTHCRSLKLSRGWTPHCFCPCTVFQKCVTGCWAASRSVWPFAFLKGEGEVMSRPITLWICPNKVSFKRFIRFVSFLSL